MNKYSQENVYCAFKEKKYIVAVSIKPGSTCKGNHVYILQQNPKYLEK